MKRPHVQVGGAIAKERCCAFAHLAGGLIRKSNSEDPPRFHAEVFDKMADAVGDNPRFAAAGAGKDQEGPFTVAHRRELWFVEAFIERRGRLGE
jgi:hypothetical protein